MKQQIENILALSKEMLANAREDRWPDFERLQKQRETIISQTEKSSATQDAQSEITLRIREIQKVDREIYLLAEKKRSEAQQILQQQRKSNKAISAYKST